MTTPGKEFGFFKKQKPLIRFNTQGQDDIHTLNNKFGGSDWRKTRPDGRRPCRGIIFAQGRYDNVGIREIASVDGLATST